jgi:hypothetical protein
MPGELLSAHKRPSSAYTLGVGTQDSQSQVIASHKPLPPKKLFKKSLFTPFGNI